MVTKIFCDWCGKELEKKDVRKIQVLIGNLDFAGADLCGDCTENLSKIWIALEDSRVREKLGFP